MNVEFFIKNNWPFGVDLLIDKQFTSLDPQQEKYILLKYKDTISVFKDGVEICEPVQIDTFSKRNIFLASLSFTDLGDQNYKNSYAIIPSIIVYNHFNFPVNVYLNNEKIAVLGSRDTNFKFNYYSQKSKSSIYLDNDQNGFKLTDVIGFSSIEKSSPQVVGQILDKWLRQVHIGKILLV